MKLGTHFVLPDLSVNVGNGAQGSMKDGLIVLVTAGSDAVSTTKIDPVLRKLVSNEYKRN